MGLETHQIPEMLIFISCRFMNDHNIVITPSKTNYLAPLFFADTVNVYPQAIYRDCCDKNNQSGARKLWDTQIISQPGGVNPTF